ncbi:MAG: phage antirepressor protein [Pseudomonas sp.]|nr:phage antirepressor protein [Pseudomonas sp.]
MEQLFEPHVFIRHKLRLHALILERQAWFCARDLGRLMGMFFENRITNKFAADERCDLLLNYYGEAKEVRMISESAVYALLVHHHHPENQQLRQWLTRHVLPLLREARTPSENNFPTPGLLEWQGAEMSILHWRDDAWIRLKDMPCLLPGRDELGGRAGWRARVKRFVGF